MGTALTTHDVADPECVGLSPGWGWGAHKPVAVTALVYPLKRSLHLSFLANPPCPPSAPWPCPRLPFPHHLIRGQQ